MGNGHDAENLKDRLARLERERLAADAIYNDALTALDRAQLQLPDLPHPPPGYDTTKLPSLNQTWDVLPQGAPAIDRSLKGRLRGFIWRIVGPSLDTQRAFNAAVVEHLNRNVATHEEAQKAIASTIGLIKEQLESQMRFQGHLIRYLQSLTLYVDTKDRSSTGGVHVLNEAMDALSDGWLKRWESLDAREQRFNARVASVDDLRTTVTLAQQTSLTLKREVERLIDGSTLQSQGQGQHSAVETSQPATHGDLDAFKYLGFEDQFRGSQADIRARLAAYVPLLQGQRDVLDIGCGRGEFLDLLREHGIPARGLDSNHEMVETSRARGLDVAEGDALSYLQSLGDGSLGAVFAAQVAEHLEPAYLMRLIETAYHKVRPGGLLILETINPACWVAFFESYIRDLTHVRPLHPETLQYLIRAHGFHNVTIEFKSPIAEAARLQPLSPAAGAIAPALADLVDTFNENVAKLNARMFTYQDYAAIGRR